VPVLEVGGTHVTAALVDLTASRVQELHRHDLDARLPASELLDALAAAADALPPATTRTWGVALPGPFDYVSGIGDFTGVEKFGSLAGVDVGAGLRARLARRAERIRFVNDADAFGLGEWLAGELRGRVAFLTLGTGVGSCFLDEGELVRDAPCLPDGGRVHLLRHAGRPLEEIVSLRALVRDYRRAGGRTADVRTIADRARGGDDEAAAAVFARAFTALGECLAPVLGAFGARTLVVGGSIARSRDLVFPALEAGLAPAGLTLDVRPAASDDSPLLGAALAARP
jgi:glucokinase